MGIRSGVWKGETQGVRGGRRQGNGRGGNKWRAKGGNQESREKGQGVGSRGQRLEVRGWAGGELQAGCRRIRRK